MPDDATTPPPNIIFTSDLGFTTCLDDDRNVTLLVGKDQDGQKKWCLETENKGLKLQTGYSDEAMMAIIDMFIQLEARRRLLERFEPFNEELQRIKGSFAWRVVDSTNAEEDPST